MKAGNDADLIEYTDASHVFDAPVNKSPVVLTAATTTRRCRLIEGNDHEIMNPETQKPFSFADTCVEKGPTIGYNEAASMKARSDVREFLTKVFGLSP